MFDFVHEKKRLVQIILAAIILTFAFWGVESYQRSGNVEVPASVDGSKITQQEFENTLNQQKNRLRERKGARFDASMFDNPEMRRSVLEGLIAQRLLILRAKKNGLIVNDEQVYQVIQGIEAFQENGQFDKGRYQTALARQNMSPLGFEARIRDELLGQQMRNAYVLNGFASERVVDNVIRLNEQQRVVSVSRILPQSFMAESKVDEAELKKYYEQNQKEFQTPEQVKVEFVKFSVDDLIGSVKVSTDEIRQYYDGHQGDFGTQEQRQAAHILIAVAATAPQVEQDAAKAKASQLLQQLKQNPAKFAELAKLNSQDPGSAANGGDLGFFGRGMMVKPFEEAAFALKQGETSELVKSDFGYHIIRLLAIKPPRILPFDEAREGIANKLRQQKAADIFAERAEKFNNVVYEQSDTLEPAADLAEVKIEQSGWLVKGAVAGQPWTEKMLQAIFTDDVIKNKRNTAAIEVAANTLVAARVMEHKPAAIRTLSEVQEGIRQKLLLLQASKLAVEHGKKTLEQLRRGENPALKWDAAQSITHAQYGALDAGLARQVFQVNKAKMPQYVGAEAALSGYVLVRVDEVKEDAKVDDAKRARYMQQLRQLTGEEMFMAYLEDAKLHADIKMKLTSISKTEP